MVILKLLSELLNSSAADTRSFNAVFNAHGLYNTEQFVLRLSPNIIGVRVKTIIIIGVRVKTITTGMIF